MQVMQELLSQLWLCYKFCLVTVLEWKLPTLGKSVWQTIVRLSYSLEFMQFSEILWSEPFLYTRAMCELFIMT